VAAASRQRVKAFLIYVARICAATKARAAAAWRMASTKLAANNALPVAWSVRFSCSDYVLFSVLSTASGGGMVVNA